MYPRNEVLKILGIELRQLRVEVQAKRLPPGSRVDKLVFYTFDEVMRIKAHFNGPNPPRKQNGYLVLREVARACGVAPNLLYDMRIDGKLDGIGIRSGKRMLYTQADVDRVRWLIPESYRAGGWQRQCREKGFYNKSAAAIRLGEILGVEVPRITFLYHVDKGHIPQPSVVYGTCKYYTEEDVAKLARWFKRNWRPTPEHKKAKRRIAEEENRTGDVCQKAGPQSCQ